MTDQEMADDSSALPEEVLKMSTDDLVARTRLLDNDCKVMRSEQIRLMHDINSMKEKIKENKDKVKVNKTLPYLVANVIELLDVDGEDQEEDGANVDLDAQRKGKCAVVKTSTRQTYFLPVIGLVEPEELSPGDLVGVNKDSYLILEKLPTEYDSRVKAMEVDEKPTEQYSDVGGLDKQIQELIEAIVLPMTHKERFDAIGIKPPKGCLMYGPPGTGKTLLARACAAQTKATFLKLAGPQLVQMFIGDGAKLVRDAFNLAKEKAPTIIFIDELDAIGTKRFDSEKAGDREVQRTMLELLNQLDGFEPNTDIKVIAATNRVDILDPALLRSGRLDRKIEFPKPDQEARARIMQIHSRKMNVSAEVNFDELSRCTDDFNGAQCKAVCVEAGMIALRRDATEMHHEDFMEAILETGIMLGRAQYVMHMRRHGSTGPSRLWAGVRYFDGLTVDEYWTLKRLTQKPDRQNVTRLEQRQALELFKKAESYNMEQARAIMAKPRNAKMLANMEKTSQDYRLATKSDKTAREEKQYDNMRVMRMLEQYGRGLTDQVKYNGIGPPDKNAYYTQYLGRGVSVYIFAVGMLMTMVLFFSFQIVNSYERYYLAAQHNLLRRTLHEFEQSDLISKFDYLVNVGSLPNIRSALMKKFKADDVQWEFNRDTNFGQINFQFRLDAKSEFVEEGGKPAQYLATLTSMGHVTDESNKLIGDMYEKRLWGLLNGNRFGDKIAALLIAGMFTYFVLEMLSVYAIKQQQTYPLLTNRSIPASRIMKRMPFIAVGCNVAALLALRGHYLVASHDQLTEQYGFPLTNHDPALEDRDRFGDELEPFTFQKWITHAAVRFIGISDVSFQSMTRTSKWHIDGLLINIEADPPRQAWIVKPDHFDDDYSTE